MRNSARAFLAIGVIVEGLERLGNGRFCLRP